MRYVPLLLIVVLLAAAAVLPFIAYRPSHHWSIVVLLLIATIGIWDLLQRRHTLLRNYPLIGHFRWLAEAIRPQVRQYFVESDTDGRPFDRNERSVVYQRAKKTVGVVPFGTELDVTAEGYEWIGASLGAPAHEPQSSPRVSVGGPGCSQPYASSVFNISAMSFGAIGQAAIRALNKGAAMGEFAHDTGEGGISAYHLEFGGDLIWEIGTGYFGCRDHKGRFDREQFADKAAQSQVKMIEIKLSQGAKPGHGGVLPAAKVTSEIARARGVLEHRDCLSPDHHSAFTTPRELIHFIAELRELSGGKPVGIKLCIGHRWEFLAICKAIVAEGVGPDFVVIDGAEGGTAAAPMEFPDHVGMPLREGLVFAHNALLGYDLRDQIRLAASGKIITGFRLAANLALGADWCNSARGFMFALGCVQSLKCHTNRCPTGITTQSRARQRGLHVEEKSHRVANFHRETVAALVQILRAAGVSAPSELQPHHLYRRLSATDIQRLDELYPTLSPGSLLDNPPEPWTTDCREAGIDSFQRVSCPLMTN